MNIPSIWNVDVSFSKKVWFQTSSHLRATKNAIFLSTLRQNEVTIGAKRTTVLSFIEGRLLLWNGFPQFLPTKKKHWPSFFLRTCSSKQRIFCFLCGFSCVERWCVDRVIDLSTPGSHIHKSTSLHSTLNGWEAAPPKREKKIKGGRKHRTIQKNSHFLLGGTHVCGTGWFFSHEEQTVAESKLMRFFFHEVCTNS